MSYKATDKNMMCRGKQYELGVEYEAQGKISLCNNGFHACEKPLDVLSYYPSTSRFFEVKQSGEQKADGQKTVSQKIKFKAEIGVIGLIKAQFDWVWDSVKKAATSGNGAHSATSGNGAHSATSGDYAHSATSGNGAHSATSGKNSIACSLGKQSRVKAGDGGWIVVVDWRYVGGESVINKIHTARVGCKLLGQKIKPNVWYWFEDGVLKSEVEVEK